MVSHIVVEVKFVVAKRKEAWQAQENMELALDGGFNFDFL